VIEGLLEQFVMNGNQPPILFSTFYKTFYYASQWILLAFFKKAAWAFEKERNKYLTKLARLRKPPTKPAR
jgi:hypothetical protein